MKNSKLALNMNTLKQLGRWVANYRMIWILLAFAATTGYSLYQASRVLSLDPTKDALMTEREKVAASRVKFDLKALDAVNQLTTINVQVDTGSVGKADPFSP